MAEINQEARQEVNPPRIRLMRNFLFCLALLVTPVLLAAQTPTYDLLIRGGRIIDGAGNAWFRGDVALRGDTIAAIGKLDGATARRVIEANGQIIAPGFIDTHSHAR